MEKSNYRSIQKGIFSAFWIIVFIFFMSFSVLAQDDCKAIGWANYDGQTYVGSPTGGGSVAITEVTTFAQLKSAAESSDAKVIYVKNSVGNGYVGTTGDVLYVKSNKTIIGYAGVTVKCSWQIKNVSNIIVRNMTLSGPGNSNSNQNWDCVNIEGSKRIWFDHCTVMEGEDGNFDVVKGSDNVSVTWCKFMYVTGGEHNLSNLIGSSDSETASHGKLNVTYAYCWWNNVNSRCPRTRYGKIHVLNSYYNQVGSGAYSGFMSNLRVEGCFFESNVSNPTGLISTGGQSGVFAIDCNRGTTQTDGYNTVFVPPYQYTKFANSEVKALVTNSSCGAGPTMDSPTQCGCGNPSTPTLVLSSGSATQSVTSGTAISQIVYTWGGSATDVNISGLPANLTASKNTTAKTVTISGTPTATGTYSVSTVQSSGTAISLSGTITVKIPVPQGPYGGTAHPIPGTVQFEHFDVGGNGVAYLDNTPGSAVTPVVNFRTDEDVDIEACGDAGGGYNLGYTTAGEWLEYTVNVTSTGLYNIELRVACNGDGRTIALQMGNTVVSPSIAIPNTVAWQTYQTVSLNNVSLTAGTQIMKVTIGATDYINLNFVTFTAVAVNKAPSVGITSPANAAGYTAPAQITIQANASDTDGTIANVEFYNGNVKIGEDIASPYSYEWNGVAAGTYNITAIATDNLGAKTSSSVISVSVLGTDCAGVAGGTAYTDNCGACVGGTTGKTACVPSKQQAEDVCQFDGTVDSDNAGFEGTGFVNTPNAIGARITLYVYTSSVTTARFDVVYANGGTTNRGAQVLIDGIEAIANFALPPTGAWTTYSPDGETLQLGAGLHKIELVALTGDGLPNIDFFEMYGGAQFTGCPQTQTVSLTQGWNLISINVVPTSIIVGGRDVACNVSTVFNGLDVQTIKTMNTFWQKGQPDYLNSLQSIIPGEGYLVYMNVVGTLTVTGIPVETRLVASLQQTGWNLIGFPGCKDAINCVSIPFSDYFNTTNCDLIKNFDGFWIPDGTQNSIDNCEPGKAYYFYFKE